MERRSLLKLAGAASAVALVTPGVLLTTGCDTSWIQKAVDDIPTISNIVGSILSIVALGNPALSPEIAALINVALQAAAAGLTLLQTLITDYKASKDSSVLTKIDAALMDVQTHLSDVLQAAHIKDAALQATIATGISLALSVLGAIALLIPEQISSKRDAALAVGVSRVKARSSMPQKVTVTDSTTIKVLYNVVAASCGYSGQLVR